MTRPPLCRVARRLRVMFLPVSETARQQSGVAQNPDPTIKLTTTKGVSRTLDDWSTMFHLCLVILPPRPEAAVFVPIARRIFNVFGDADCRTAFCVVGNEFKIGR